MVPIGWFKLRSNLVGLDIGNCEAIWYLKNLPTNYGGEANELLRNSA